MSDETFDLIVIGTGPAGSSVARKANKQGKRVAIVEAREFGGTCALRGCNPKKVYTNAATLVDQARTAQGKLARFDEIRIDWPELLAFKRTFTEPVIEKSEKSFQKYGISTFNGAASFDGPQQIVAGEHRLTAQRILVATGAKPARLKIPGEELVVTSDEFMELSTLPAKVVFVGGGYISMEFAHVAARFGSDVTILHRGEQVLESFYPDLVSQLVEWSEKQGVHILTGAKVVSVERAGEELLSVGFEQEQRHSVEASLVVHGGGRVPNLTGLELAAGNVDFDETGIQVDEFMRSSSNHAVFAAGDCAASGVPALTPAANEVARIVAKNLFASNPEQKPDYGAVPRVVFTVPPLAAIGMTEDQARDAGHRVDVHYEDTSEWNSVRKSGHACAGFKILIDQQTDQILGAHLLGPSADETINLFALAMRFGHTAREMKSTLFAFPTFAADVRQML